MSHAFMSDGDSRLLHTTDRTVTVEVSDEIATEVALRTRPDASPREVRDVLADHVMMHIEYVSPEIGEHGHTGAFVVTCEECQVEALQGRTQHASHYDGCSHE
jgi:hypothetical protein